VNLGRSRSIQNVGKSGRTGIFKEPAWGPVAVTASGLQGDVVVDIRNHGGPDQAVYLFGAPDYEWWADEVGRELPPGSFGENMAVSGLRSASLDVGDRLHVGTAVLAVKAPRIPCATLAGRMWDPVFFGRFRRAERPGVYCRVSYGRVTWSPKTP
jgi:MOSC domain-containing protein YiiM